MPRPVAVDHEAFVPLRRRFSYLARCFMTIEPGKTTATEKPEHDADDGPLPDLIPAPVVELEGLQEPPSTKFLLVEGVPAGASGRIRTGATGSGGR